MVIVNKKGFSLIELFAVVIILTIITLISIPIVLNAINAQKVSQNKRSIDTYGKDIETALDRYKVKNDGMLTTNYDDLKEYITISDDEVKCDSIGINENGALRLTDCSVNGTKVLDENGNAYVYTTVKAE